MAQWVLDALDHAQSVESILMTGLGVESGLTCRKKPLGFLPDQGSLFANLLAGMHHIRTSHPNATYVLIVSADIPALRPGMVDWLAQTAQQTQDDVYYGVVPRAVMEARYPGSLRTWTHFKDLVMCGADIHISHLRMAEQYLHYWDFLLGNRKIPWQQVRLLGLGTLLLLFLRQLTINDLASRIHKRFGIRGRAILWKDAEAGMDVDKPHHLEMILHDLKLKE